MALLSVEALSKRYGALVVSDGVSLELAAGECHAVIGPNGAGKTTLIGQLGGEVPSDSGRVRFDGRDITGWPPERRARHGLARSYQITSVVGDFSALENVMLAVIGRQRSGWRCWRPAARDAALVDAARQALRQVGLDAQAAAAAADLGHGERRQLELAMVLAAQPRLLLLDEPMAGMSPAESGAMTALLRTLKGRYAMLLVEHDMDAVFALADRISVLVGGRVIVTGSAQQVQRDARVREAYLGDESVGSHI